MLEMKLSYYVYMRLFLRTNPYISISFLFHIVNITLFVNICMLK